MIVQFFFGLTVGFIKKPLSSPVASCTVTCHLHVRVRGFELMAIDRADSSRW